MRKRTTICLAAALLAGFAPKPAPPSRVMDVHELKFSLVPPEPRRVLVRGVVRGPFVETGYLLIDEQRCGRGVDLAQIEIAEGPQSPPDIAAYWKVLDQTRPFQGPELHVVFEAVPVYLKHIDGRWWLTKLKVRRVVSQTLRSRPSCASSASR